MRICSGIVAVIALIAGIGSAAAQEEPLHRLEELQIRPVLRDQTSVSGTSAGAFMAVQFAILHPEQVISMGAIAGGPFFCAGLTDYVPLWPLRAKTWRAHTRYGGDGECMDRGTPDLSRSLERARALLSDEQEELVARQTAWLYSGSKDDMVKPSVVDTTAEFLRRMGVAVDYQRGPAVHGHVVDWPDGCDASCCGKAEVEAAGYFVDCDYDAARRILETAYGPTQEQESVEGGELLAFSQRDLLPGFGSSSRAFMARSGYVYIPPICRKEACRVHIALHGCGQGPDGKVPFARKAGYNEWAQAFRAIILYPMVDDSAAGNPNECWDWWGYTDRGFSLSHMKADGTYATREAPQIRMLDMMLSKLAQPR